MCNANAMVRLSVTYIAKLVEPFPVPRRQAQQVHFGLVPHFWWPFKCTTRPTLLPTLPTPRAATEPTDRCLTMIRSIVYGPVLPGRTFRSKPFEGVSVVWCLPHVCLLSYRRFYPWPADQRNNSTSFLTGWCNLAAGVRYWRLSCFVVRTSAEQLRRF